MNMIKEIQAAMEHSIAYSEVMGVNLLVTKNGKEVCYMESGMADREQGRIMSRDTIFRLYSQTKPVTAAAAMILMERGKLDLCQPVSDFLPSYTHMTVSVNGVCKTAERPIRVLDLLRMTSGLVYPNGTDLPGLSADKVFNEICQKLDKDNAMNTLQVANALAKTVLAFEPGSSWQYGSSADVLGAVIEVASGMSFAEFLRKEIFIPLQMSDTDFWVPDEKQHRLAATYETVTDKNSKAKMILYTGNNLAINNHMAIEPAFASGGAGLVSTLDDYMKFATMLLQNGELNGVRILKPATVPYLISGQLMPIQQAVFDSANWLDGFTYQNLMRVCINPSQTGYLAREGEYGWDGWLGAYFANFPKEQMTILMGTQKKDAGTFALTRKLRNIILSTL